MKLTEPIKLENEKWAIIYSFNDFENANLLLEML